MNAVNVLIVDDHPQWASIAAAILRPVTSRIQFAGTWHDALNKLDGPNGPEVVMLDMELPDSPAKDMPDRVNAIKGAGRKVVLLTPAPVREDTAPSFLDVDGVLYKGDVDMAEKLMAFCR